MSASTTMAAASSSVVPGAADASRPVDFKIIVLGDSSVGKSSLIRQFVHRSFDERLLATVGCDFSTKTFTVDVPAVSRDVRELEYRTRCAVRRVSASSSPVRVVPRGSGDGPADVPELASTPQNQQQQQQHLSTSHPSSKQSGRPLSRGGSFLGRLRRGASFNSESATAGSGAATTADDRFMSNATVSSNGSAIDTPKGAAAAAAGARSSRPAAALVRAFTGPDGVHRIQPQENQLARPPALVDGGAAADAANTTPGASPRPSSSEPATPPWAFTAGPGTRLARVCLQIWDTAGGERHNSLGALFYRGADACVLVFDVTKPRSFARLEYWADEFAKHSASTSSAFTMVVGNKADLPHDQHLVSPQEVADFCARRGFQQWSPDLVGDASATAYAIATAIPGDGPWSRLRDGDLRVVAASHDENVATGTRPAPTSAEELTTTDGRGTTVRHSAADQSALLPVVTEADEERSPTSPNDDGPLLQQERDGDVESAPTTDAAAAGAVAPKAFVPFGLTATATEYASVQSVFAMLAIEAVLRRDIAAERAAIQREATDGGPDACPAERGSVPNDPLDPSQLGSSTDAKVNLRSRADSSKPAAKKKKQCQC